MTKAAIDPTNCCTVVADDEECPSERWPPRRWYQGADSWPWETNYSKQLPGMATLVINVPKAWLAPPPASGTSLGQGLTFKTLVTFHFTDWFIGILTMAYYRIPYIPQITKVWSLLRTAWSRFFQYIGRTFVVAFKMTTKGENTTSTQTYTSYPSRTVIRMHSFLVLFEGVFTYLCMSFCLI